MNWLGGGVNLLGGLWESGSGIGDLDLCGGLLVGRCAGGVRDLVIREKGGVPLDIEEMVGDLWAE